MEGTHARADRQIDRRIKLRSTVCSSNRRRKLNIMNVIRNQQSAVANGLFQGNRKQARNFLKDNPGRYYVYILRRPDLRPFYVGKGKAYRLFNHVDEARHTENSHKLNVIR